MSSERIQLTRSQLVAQFVEVTQPPAILSEKFQDYPLCHLLSTYVIRPVACDQRPFVIHHKNKQPILLAQPYGKKKQNKKNQGEVDNLDDEPEGEASDDDEFETVTGDKKRVARKKVEQAPVVEANPLFPASDPGKVKVIQPKKKDPAATKEKKEQKQKAKDTNTEQADEQAQDKPAEEVKEQPAQQVPPKVAEAKPVEKELKVPKVEIEKAQPKSNKPKENKVQAPVSARGNAKADKTLEKAKNEENKNDGRAATARAPAAKKPDPARDDIFKQFQMANEGKKPEYTIPTQQPAQNKRGGANTRGRGGKKDPGDNTKNDDNKEAKKPEAQETKEVKQQKVVKEEVAKQDEGQKVTEKKEKQKKPAQAKKAPAEEEKQQVKPQSAKPAAPKSNVLEENKREEPPKKAPKAKMDDIMKKQEQQARAELEEKKQEIAKIDPFDFKAQMELGNQLTKLQHDAHQEKRALKAQKKGKGGGGGGGQKQAPERAPAKAATKPAPQKSGKSDFELMMEKRV